MTCDHVLKDCHGEPGPCIKCGKTVSPKNQPSLFDPPPPDALFVRGSATSKRAAKRIEPTRLSKRELVYRFIASRGERGATRTEIAEALAMSENTVRPRVVELMESVNGTPPRIMPSGDERDGREVLIVNTIGVLAE